MTEPQSLAPQATKLQQMIDDFAIDQVSYIDMKIAIEHIEHELEIKTLMIELILNYLTKRSDSLRPQPRLYLENNVAYWQTQAEQLHTMRLDTKDNPPAPPENRLPGR